MANLLMGIFVKRSGRLVIHLIVFIACDEVVGVGFCMFQHFTVEHLFNGLRCRYICLFVSVFIL